MDVTVADTGGTEDSGCIDGHASNTNPFLHDLKPDDELNTTASMELARADASEHGPVGRAGCSFTLEFGDVANVLELSLGLAHIITRLATETTEDVATFFLPPDLDQPTG